MEDLIDIQGLDYIGWWPLSLAWWVLIACALGVLAACLFMAWRFYKYRKSWQYQAFRRLTTLQQQVDQNDPKQLLQALSMEMRKIAMHSTQRESCAGLIGNKWLQWLQQHDPAGFDWVANGNLLVNVQYMPEAMQYDAMQIATLINAAQGWVKKC